MTEFESSQRIHSPLSAHTDSDAFHSDNMQLGDNSPAREVLIEFLQLGAVDALVADGPLSSDDLAERCHVGRARMALILNKLHGYGVVTHADDLFDLREQSKNLLWSTLSLPTE